MQQRRSTTASGVLAEVVPNGEVMVKINKRECMWCYNELAADGECNMCGNPQPIPTALPNRYMVMQLHFDSESFNELKELLRVMSVFQASPAPSTFISGGVRDASMEIPSHRRRREALERVFAQIRNVEYHDV